MNGAAALTPITNLPPSPVDRPIRVMVLGDSPTCYTGFGRINRDLLSYLPRGRYEFEVVGINYHANPTDVAQEWPDRIYAANPGGLSDDYCGRQLAVDILATSARQGRPFDIFFAHQDMPILAPLAEAITGNLKAVAQLAGSVFYSPLDADPEYAPAWFNVLTAPDVFATYTYWAAEQIGKHVEHFCKVVPPGCDPLVFHPLPMEQVAHFRESYLQVHDPETFIIASVNRNQERKDLPRLLLAYKLFLDANPKQSALLYMHCDPVDMFCDLNVVAKKLGLEGKVVFAPKQMRFGAPHDAMNLIYNAAHAVASMSRGEGWGMGTTEAMAVGTPVAVALNTAAHDLLGTGFIDEALGLGLAQRGVAVRSGGREHEVYGLDGMRRPLASVGGMALALQFICDQYGSLMGYGIDHESPLLPRVQNARSWVPTSETMARRFDKVFTELVACRERGEAPPRRA